MPETITPLAANFRGQKIARQTTSTTEVGYAVTALCNDPGAQLYLQIQASGAALYYHTTAGSAAADGYPIAAGQPFTIPLGNVTMFYLVAQAGTGTFDAIVL